MSSKKSNDGDPARKSGDLARNPPASHTVSSPEGTMNSWLVAGASTSHGGRSDHGGHGSHDGHDGRLTSKWPAKLVDVAKTRNGSHSPSRAKCSTRSARYKKFCNTMLEEDDSNVEMETDLAEDTMPKATDDLADEAMLTDPLPYSSKQGAALVSPKKTEDGNDMTTDKTTTATRSVQMKTRQASTHVAVISPKMATKSSKKSKPSKSKPPKKQKMVKPLETATTDEDDDSVTAMAEIEANLGDIAESMKEPMDEDHEEDNMNEEDPMDKEEMTENTKAATSPPQKSTTTKSTSKSTVKKTPKSKSKPITKIKPKPTMTTTLANISKSATVPPGSNMQYPDT
eukprot:scaffold56522_cov59-Attheya_sp.AAC.8